MDYPDELLERYYDYPLAPKIMTLDVNLTGEKKMELRAAFFKAQPRAAASESDLLHSTKAH